MADQTSESFLARWSRRKAEDRAPSDTSSPEAAFQAAAPLPHEEVLAPAPQAHCDELEFGSDFSQFLQTGTAEAVHVSAFRRLWLSSSLFGASDGLDVYNADYTRTFPLETPADVASNGLGVSPSTRSNCERSGAAGEARACLSQEVAQAVVEPAAEGVSST